MAKRKLTKAEKLARVPIEEVSKYGTAELLSALRTLSSGYKRRVGSFIRRGIFSYAQEKFESSMQGKGKPFSEMSRNQLLIEYFRYANFFNDKTSTVEGIKQVNREQDIRIFGEGRGGRPLYSMHEDERKQFWRLYDEFKNQNKDATTKYGSESIQQSLADMLLNQVYSEKFKTHFLNKLAKQLEDEKFAADVEEEPNVFSGRRNTRSR